VSDTAALARAHTAKTDASGVRGVRHKSRV
jgi:hypothetical protein